MLPKFFSKASYWAMVAALLVLGISAAFTPETLPHLPMCSFKQITGRPCPGCGLTRAFCCISHGRFASAWHFNPFGFIFYAFAVAMAVWPLLAWRFPRLDNWGQRTYFFMYVAPGVVIVMTIFGVIRMFCGPSDI